MSERVVSDESKDDAYFATIPREAAHLRIVRDSQDEGQHSPP